MGKRGKVFNKISLFISIIFIINFLTLNFSLKIEEAHASIARSSELMMNPTRPIDFDMSIIDKVYTKFDFSRYIGATDTITKLTIKRGNEAIQGEAIESSNNKAFKAKFVAIHGQEFELQIEGNISGHNQKMMFKILYEDTDIYFKPKMGINGKNVECDLKSWAERYKEDHKVSIKVVTGSNTVVIPETYKLISDLKNNKVIFDNKADGFQKDTGYLLMAVKGDKTYKYKFYCANDSKNNKVLRNQDAKLVEASIKDNSTLDLKVSANTIKDNKSIFKIFVSNDIKGKIDVKKKTGTFTGIDIPLNKSVNTRVEKGENEVSEAVFNLHLLEKFQKFDCEIKPLNISNTGLSIKFGDMSDFLSGTDANNKIYVYELGDNYQKNKIGEKIGNLSPTSYNDIKFSTNKTLIKNKTYFVELTNSTRTIGTSFVFLPLEANHKNIEYTVGKITWTYPVGYVPVSGDKIEIFLKDKRTQVEYPSIPNRAFIHGSNGVDLSKIKEADITGLAPGSQYEAKVVLSKQGISSESITSFTTKEFKLKSFIDVKDAFYGNSSIKIAHPRNRKITVKWDYEPQDMTFGEYDKVQIFIKPNSSDNFENYPKNDKYKNPYFEEINGTSNKLKNLKEATITVPSYSDRFYVDLVYTIGGKQIINSKSNDEKGEIAYNRRTVQALVVKPKLTISDKTQTTATLTWEYDASFKEQNPDKEQYKPEDGHIIKGLIKKVNSLNDSTTEGFGDESEGNSFFYYEHGREVDGQKTDLLNKKQFELKNLDPDQCYRIKVQHIVQHPGFDENYRSVAEYINFKTESFSISNLKSEIDKTDSRHINLTWDTKGVPVFNEDKEDIKVFLKEASTSNYPEEPLVTEIKDGDIQKKDGETEVPTGKKNCQIEIPSYNTQYNAKVEYTLKGGKKVSEFVLIRSDIDMSVTINEIKNGGGAYLLKESPSWQATVTCTLPSGYVKKENKDKIKLTVIEQSEQGKKLPNSEELTIDSTKATKKIENGLEENKTYEVKAEFINDNKVVDTVTSSFKVTDKFQVIDMKVSDIKATTATLTWDYIPSGKLDELTPNTDKVEIYLKVNSKDEKSRSKRSTDSLEDWTKIYTMKHKESEESTYSIPTFNSNEELISNVPQIRQGESHSQAKEVEGDIKNFKELNLKDLEVGKDYSIAVKYTADTALSGDSSQGVLGASVDFKTVPDTFKSTVFVANQTSATFGWEYPAGYIIQDGDKVQIFIKEVKDPAAGGEKIVKKSLPGVPSKKISKVSKIETTQTNADDGWGNALLTLTHGTSGENVVDLNEITAVDVSGLTPERKYKGKISFTMGKDSPYTISSEVDISTFPFEIKSFELDSYQEYDILVNWAIDPENMMFNPSDTLEIFVKLASEQEYPKDPVYKLTTDDTDDGKNISNTFSDYILATSLGVPQKAKLVYTIGERKYEKELEFTNTINPMTAKVSSINETRALIEITYPDNYEFVNGDKLLIYAKDEFVGDAELESDDFLVFEGVQSDDLSIPDNMRMIELSYLLPEANYDVLVKLDLLDGSVEPVKLNFRTEALPVSDPKLEAIGYNSTVISWDYGDNAIDFYLEEGNYEFTDKLIIAHKETDGTPIPADISVLKTLPHKEYLGEDIKTVKDATIEVEDPSKEYDVAICYDLGGLLYMKNTKASYLSVKAEEESITSNGAKIGWKYPTNIQLTDSDKTEVFVRKSSETDYPSSPSFSSTGSGTTSTNLESLEGGVEYVAKVQITKEGLKIDPVEVKFTTKGAFGEETVVEEIPEEIAGTDATIPIPEGLPVDTSGELQVVMGNEEYSAFTISFTDDGTGFTISPTIPKKKYENIQVTIPLEDGSTHTIVIPELVTQPADVAQEWLSNAYWFAFERFPDEGGYNYWYGRMKEKTINGEYFLKNLMFAEDEFTNRNLSDQDLIAALYQIVVNREYDQGGLDFWIGIYNENLQNAGGNKKLAQEVLVDRMVHEPEFGKLCERVGIFWTQAEQDAAGVPS